MGEAPGSPVPDVSIWRDTSLTSVVVSQTGTDDNCVLSMLTLIEMKNGKIAMSVQQYDLCVSQQNLAWWCKTCMKWVAIKNFNFKIQKGDRRRMCLLRIGLQASWVFKITFLTASPLDWHVLHHRAKFCGDQSNCCGDITIFVFSYRNVKIH